MLVALAVGDAYGAGFEYAPREYVSIHNTLQSYVQHPWHRLSRGSYTDDTQMSVAIAELIVSGRPWTRESLADAFVATFKRDPRDGYANSFSVLLRRVRDGQQLLREIRPNSEKSGAAMRAAPVGVFPVISEVLEKAQVQATVTHNTTEGIQSAQAAALATHYFLYQLGPKQMLPHFLTYHIPGPWERQWSGPVGPRGCNAVQAAITALMRSGSMSELLRRCVEYTGDVDTVATIALAAGACCLELEQDLPSILLTTLEDGAFGHTYLLELDRKLLSFVRS